MLPSGINRSSPLVLRSLRAVQGPIRPRRGVPRSPTSASLFSNRLQLFQRLASTASDVRSPSEKPKSFLNRHRFLGGLLWGSFSVVFGICASIAIILAHDALTYQHRHLEQVTPSPLALDPQPGGPKNLPIISEYVEGEEDEFQRSLKGKERLVIVGSGWAAVSLLRKLEPGRYNVTLVSPNNFYLFTPLLPSATVGTVEPRSLIEPIRKILSRHRGHYVQGKAVDVELGSLQSPEEGGTQRLLEVQLVSGEANVALPGRGHPEADSEDKPQPRKEFEGRRIYIPYDKLIVAVGSVTSTHGVPGMENAFHLKELDDARGIRSRILDNLEIASLPTTTPEERSRLLSFVISGGGPTGVETAAEIYDMLNEDVLNYYPKLLRQQARVSLIQSRSHILNTYSEKISKYAEEKFARDAVDVIVNARVKEVKEHSVVYTVRDDEGKVTEHEIPSGMTLWSTGISMSPFTKHMTNILPNQSHLKALLVDSHLRVKGTPPGSVYALGDASTIDTRLIDSLYEFVDSCDSDHDGRLTFDEFSLLAGRVGRKFPLASDHFVKLHDLFDRYDFDRDGTMSLNEIARLFLETQNKMTALPATAQVASQQGSYLAKKLNKLAKLKETGKLFPSVGVAEQAIGQPGSVDLDDEHYKPFKYRNLGALVFLGGEAAAFDSLPFPEPVRSFAGGLVAMYAWRSFYLSEQVSMRTRLLLLSDYIRRGIWGRDLSRL